MLPTVAQLAARVPPLGLGLMRLRETPGAGPDRDRARVVDAALDAGIALLDTAEMYGNEELVGRLVARRRDEVVLATKFGVRWGPSGRFDDWSVRADATTVRTSCEASLRRLGVDVIDLYSLHHRSETTPIEETVGALADLVGEGKVREIGLSNVTVEDVRRGHAVHPVAAVQEQWALTERAAEPFLPVLRELDIVLVAHSPTAHGALHAQADTTGGRLLADVAARHEATVGQVALAWVHASARRAGQPVLSLPGTGSVRHLRELRSAVELDLGDDLARLDAVSA